jgi:hypothetical protein
MGVMSAGGGIVMLSSLNYVSPLIADDGKRQDPEPMCLLRLHYKIGYL